MKNVPWPWACPPIKSDFRSPANTDLCAAFGFGVDPKVLDEFCWLLESALPEPIDHYRIWFKDRSRLCLKLADSKGAAMLVIGFDREEDGALILNAGYLHLRDDWQGQGVGTLVLQRMLTGCDLLGVDSIRTVANINVGSYAWARRGARPLFPDEIAENLRARIRLMEQHGRWNPQQADHLLQFIESNKSDVDLMFRIAGEVYQRRNLGRELLSPQPNPIGVFSWDAKWDLLPDEDRRRIIDAVRRRKS